MTKPADELDRLLSREAKRLAVYILALAEARALGRGEAELLDLGRALTVLLASGDLLGRRRVILEAKRAGMPALPGGGGGGWEPPEVPPSREGGGPIVPDGGGIPKIDWPDSVAQIELREPRLIQAVPGEGSLSERMGRLYANQGFALARSTDAEVTAKVQQVLARAMARGEKRMTTEALIEEMGDWGRSYANLVYRNNMNTAYTSALFDQAQDPDVAAVMPAVEFVAVMDSDTTGICRAFHGTVAAPGSPVWDGRTTPCHHGCRSGMNLVDRLRLTRMGLYENGRVVERVPNPAARAAPGFGHRRGLRLHP